MHHLGHLLKFWKYSYDFIRILSQAWKHECPRQKLNDQEIESLRKLDAVTSEKEELKLKNEALKMYVNQHVCGDQTVKTEPGQSGSIQSYLESLELGQSLLKKKRQ